MSRRHAKVLPACLIAVALLFFRCTTFTTPPSDTRRDFLQQLGAGAAVIAAGQSVGVQPAQAAIARWSGIYDDPKHPGCEREIRKDGDEFVISGTSATDGSKACAEDAPTKKWYLIGKPSGGGFGGPSDELLVDFSPKGGPKDALAKWDGDGIVFPDGNRWSKIKRKPGQAVATWGDGPSSPLAKFAKGKVPT
ncbi:unnamed protein product [Effrenium voratum]|uniref:Uncharacterized protein n=1 Tax=Effrenium voratum TaxID=2562239 RepID=A0AA36MRG6_9DINO|nr:unnamed protein product [Effrenium voratum]CAJ1377413.1 unnamed protein product [Effrenium voratum]CAJ1453470.1 unnamed protein product [Effrenium voratum]|mmetsp:Transcript_127622/g.303245  ORF Transcript_127622/g.303245 Transcript_127622/m.303245 type:complete len:193 (+) Transcript_127622:58-636(+)